MRKTADNSKKCGKVVEASVCDLSLVPISYRSSVNAITLPYLARTGDELLKLLPQGARIETFDNPRPVFSSIPFAYERMDCSGLKELSGRLAPCLEGARDDWDRIMRILGWAYSRYPRKEQPWPKPESAFEILANAAKGICDVCDSKALLLIQGLLSAGYIGRFVEYSRYVGAANFPDCNHGFIEAWIDALQKWVVLDPTPNAYFVANEKNVPLNSLEIHNIYMDSDKDGGIPGPDGLLPAGKIKAVYGQYDHGRKYDRLDEKSIRQRTFYYFNICMRNDFMSKNCRPGEPQYYLHRHRTHYCYLDRCCGPRPLFENHTAAAGDLYWTVNWTWLAFKKAPAADCLEVYLETGMPSFSHLELKVNGEPMRLREHKYPAPSISWALKKGKNTLEAQVVNVKGVKGKKVKVTIAGDF